MKRLNINFPEMKVISSLKSLNIKDGEKWGKKIPLRYINVKEKNSFKEEVSQEVLF